MHFVLAGVYRAHPVVRVSPDDEPQDKANRQQEISEQLPDVVPVAERQMSRAQQVTVSANKSGLRSVQPDMWWDAQFSIDTSRYCDAMVHLEHTQVAKRVISGDTHETFASTLIPNQQQHMIHFHSCTIKTEST